MLIVMAILFLIIGLLLLLNSLIKLFFVRARSRSIKFLSIIGILGLIFFILSIYLFSINDSVGVSKLSLGIIILIISFLVIGLGVWISFFSPFSSRDYKDGLKLLFLGFAILIISIVIITINLNDFQHEDNISKTQSTVNSNSQLVELFNYRMNHFFGIKWGYLTIFMLIGANLIVLARKPEIHIFIIADLIVIVAAITMYNIDKMFLMYH